MTNETKFALVFKNVRGQRRPQEMSRKIDGEMKEKNGIREKAEKNWGPIYL